MVNFEETFKGLLLEFLRRNGVEATEVTGWDEDVDVYSYRGCHTCGPSYDKDYEVWIYYTPDNVTQYGSEYTYTGKFGDLLDELVGIGNELDAREAE